MKKTTTAKAKTAKPSASVKLAKPAAHAAKPAPPKAAPAAPAAAVARKPGAVRREKWPARELEMFRRTLLQMREQLTGQIEALKIDSLTREDAVNSEEDGTDAFERQFALNIVRAESHSVTEIDDALKRLSEGNYGVCEECACLIGRARLAALPFVRLCVACKSKQESGKPHYQPTVRETEEPPAREPRERE